MIRINDVHSIKCIAYASRVQFVPRLHHAIADYDATDKLKGGVLFTDWNSGSVLIHMAGFRPNWVSKSMLWLAFQYPFEQLKVKKLFGLVPESNIAARNSNLRLGFKIEILLADVFSSDEYSGMYVMSMYKKDCKWLHMKEPHIDWAPEHMVSRVEDSAPAAVYH